jgi:membrane-associated phospholipid phosphatase|eukprot:scaffold71_cov265-Chaetoceros_neogracile.AAC.3
MSADFSIEEQRNASSVSYEQMNKDDSRLIAIEDSSNDISHHVQSNDRPIDPGSARNGSETEYIAGDPLPSAVANSMRIYRINPCFVVELVVCISIGVLGHFAPDMIFQMGLHERQIPYQETANGDIILDQYINRPLVEKETIRDWQLVLIALIIPLAVVITVGAIGKTRNDVHSGVCTFFFVVGCTEFITSFVKLYAGYFRPNFYNYCQFSGEDMACSSDRLDPRKSFPSGHASMSFCSMTLLTLFFFGKIGLHRKVGESGDQASLMKKRFLSALSGCPMFFAVFIAASRVHDDMHHPADVVGGALIGIACANFGYGLW